MDGFRKVMEVNLMSLMACAEKFYEMLKVSKGALIIVSSTAAHHATKGNRPIAPRRPARSAWCTLAQAYDDGIRVNGIAPGLVDTKMTKVTTDNLQRLAGALATIPMKQLGTPADRPAPHCFSRRHYHPMCLARPSSSTAACCSSQALIRSAARASPPPRRWRSVP